MVTTQMFYKQMLGILKYFIRANKIFKNHHLLETAAIIILIISIL